jgi:peptide/nickel transport system permease protein
VSDSAALGVLLRIGRPAIRFVISPGWSRRVGLAGVALFVLIALIGPVVSPYGANAQHLDAVLQHPSWQHPFGTDGFGRDILTRVMTAARVDLQIGFFGVTIPLVIGTVIGLLAGYYGGLLDIVSGRLIDVFTAFPFFVIVIAIVAMLGPGLRNLYIAISVVSWVAYARLIRGETLSAKRREYVSAAHGLGYRDLRILRRHLLPNVVAPALVFAMSDFILDILVGASLGFFGLGVQPPGAEWGTMIADGRDFIITDPWLVFFPGAAIVVLGFFVSLLGDGLADYIRRLDARG